MEFLVNKNNDFNNKYLFLLRHTSVVGVGDVGVVGDVGDVGGCGGNRPAEGVMGWVGGVGNDVGLAPELSVL